MPDIICMECSVSLHHLCYFLENSKKTSCVIPGLALLVARRVPQQLDCWKILSLNLKKKPKKAGKKINKSPVF